MFREESVHTTSEVFQARHWFNCSLTHVAFEIPIAVDPCEGEKLPRMEVLAYQWPTEELCWLKKE